MKEKHRFVSLATTGKFTLTELCADFKVSQNTGHNRSPDWWRLPPTSCRLILGSRDQSLTHSKIQGCQCYIRIVPSPSASVLFALAGRQFQSSVAVLDMPLNAESIRDLAEQAFAFRETLTPESDRGCALMAASFLDERLKTLIEKSLIPDKLLLKRFLGFNGPAGSFSSRIDFAYLSSLVGKTVHADLHLIRKIRNDFGHRVEPISFETPAISQICSAFRNTNAPKNARPRLKYTNTCFGVLSAIDMAIMSQEQRKPKPDFAMSAHEVESTRTDFIIKFDKAIATLGDKEISKDPVGAKKKLFAAVIGEMLNRTSRPESGRKGSHVEGVLPKSS